MIYNWHEGWIETPLGRFTLGPLIAGDGKVFDVATGEEIEYVQFYNDETHELERLAVDAEDGGVAIGDDDDAIVIRERRELCCVANVRQFVSNGLTSGISSSE